MIKHNYSNGGLKRVTLWLSKDENTLYYRPVNPEKKVVAYLRGARNLRFNNLRGFFYGPFSTTFLARREKVLTAINYEKKESGQVFKEDFI